MSNEHFDPPTANERKVLRWLRRVLQPTTRTITLYARNGVIDRAEAEERISDRRRVHDILREADHQDVIIKRQDGRDTTIIRRLKEKL